ncbi:MAG: tetratricopeptide repeat protein [Planctomycetales bacterium]|nr:tetratricopeptide repeat protein [Planctomycetales bacterium]
MSDTSASLVGPAAEQLAEISSLYGQGLYLQAFELSRPHGPLHTWTQVDAQVLGGRLAHNLGSGRVCRILHRRAFRQAPQHPEACYFYILSVMQRRGPWQTWQALRSIGDLEQASSDVRADWFAIHAHVLALLRDFQQSETWFTRAEELAPERAWIWVERALIYELEDRLDEALTACRRALELRPYYRPAVQMMAHRLVQMNQDDEAIQLLEDATARLESADVPLQLSSLYVEKETQYERAQQLLQRAEQLMPLMDPLRKRWIAARKADVLYYLGDYQAAAESAKQVKTPFFDRLATRLEDSRNEHQRVRLKVDFIKQHHLTCAPATLAAISEYWKRSVDHLEVAEEICYDGTPGHKERRWAEDQGFVTREFRVTEEIAKTLIDRGCPFTLTTVDPGSAHLQAVIGYDSNRGTLLVRDPNERHFGEFDLKEMLKYYGSSGPRGMVMAPPDQAQLLDGIDFPEGDLYDLNYRMERALETFRREEAQQHYDEMAALSADSRMTIQARGTLARYDSDQRELIACVELLLEKFPKDVNLTMMKLQFLRDNGTRDERLELLEQLYQQPDCDPLFWSQYAIELRADAARFNEAATLLERTMRYRPHDGRAYGMLADIRMDQRQRDTALLLHRFAASLDDTDEGRARHYFHNARFLGKTKEALEFLKDRFRRFSKRSSAPARTLAWAYDELDHTARAFELLEKAIKLRPDDGEFHLYLADMYGRYGKHDRAQELLELARPNAHPTMLQRAAGTLATYRGDLPASLEAWQQILAAEPFDGDAHENVARLLADLQGEDAAIAHLRKAVESNPHSYSMRVRLIEWLRGGDAAEYESQLRELTTMHEDAWGRRELAVALIKQNRLDEAEAEIAIAERLEPETPVVHYLTGYLQQRRGNLPEAREAFRVALTKSVDYDLAISSLIDACDTKAERVEALRFVYRQLREQVILGDGLLTYREHAEATLPAEALLKELKQAWKARPDLWHVHSALIQQLVEMKELDDALKVAQAAAKRFPLLPRVWLDLAVVRHAREEYAEEVKSLQAALNINSSWSDASRQLAEAERAQGNLAEACEVLQKAIQREPRDVRNLAMLADVMWEQGRRDEAIEQLKQIVRMEPGFDYAWGRLRSWFAELQQPEGPVEVARELCKTRPAEARSWLVLAECQDAAGNPEGCLEAVLKMLELNPVHVQARDLGAQSLCRLGRFDEALQLVHPPELEGRMPLKLIGAEAETHMSAGHRDHALKLMNHVVAEDSDAVWAWFRLAEWYDNDDLDRYRQACDQLVRLAPEAAVSWGYYADGALRSGERHSAKEAFRKAMSLDPEYAYASRQLYELHIEDEEYDEAAEVLAEVVHYWPEAFGLGEQVRIESLRGNGDRAAQLFEQLIELPEADEDAIDTAIGGMVHLEQGETAERMLRQRVLQPDASEGVGTCWVRLSDFNENLEEVETMLGAAIPSDEVFGAAAGEYLRVLNRMDLGALAVNFVHEHRDRINRHPRAWSGAVYLLHEAGKRREALQWLDGWQEREGLTGECLLLPMMALRRAGQDEQATAMNQFALELPGDISTATHALCLALQQILDGSPEEVFHAYDMIEGMEEDQVTDFGKIVLKFVRAIEPGMLQQATYSAAAQQLKREGTEAKDRMKHDKLIKQIYRQLRVRLAEAYDKKFMAWWAKLSS